MGVVWKEIPGYSRYLASEDGRVWDKKTEKEVSQVLTGGILYYYINVYNDKGERKLKRTNRLIAKAFCEGRSPEKDVVDHIDRDKYNNHYTNLRWTDVAGNSRNRDITIFVSEDETLREWVGRVYGEDDEQAIYSYLHRRMSLSGDTFEEAIESYETYLERGRKTRKIVHEGEEMYLTDFCEKYSLNYEDSITKLRLGWDSWSIQHGLPPIGSYPYQGVCKYDKDGVVNIWYKTRDCLLEWLKVKSVTLNSVLEKDGCLEDIINRDPKDAYRITVLGVYGTREEICKHFGKTLGAVETQMTRHGSTFEEALVLPRQRVKKIEVNGLPMTPKALWDKYGINHKRANRYRNDNGKTYEETLEHFGVDTTGIVITF